MVSSRKIDSFFEKQQSFDFERSENKPEQSRWLRIMKLFFPCIAALLIIMLVVIPNIRNNVDLKDNITLPRKNEMEKLHVEETVFSVTDKKNRVNTVIADSIDEVEPGSQKVKILNPHGSIPTDDAAIEVKAATGYFNQNGNILDLKEDVVVTTAQNTIINTDKATYDFNQELGFGEDKISAKGDWGTLQADGFIYHKNNDLLILQGNSNLQTDSATLSAQKKNSIYLKQNKVDAEGNATITNQDGSLSADKIMAEFIQTKSGREIKNLRAIGNVTLCNGKELVLGDKGHYENDGTIEIWGNNAPARIIKDDKILKAQMMKAYYTADKKRELQKVEAFGNVEIISPKGTAVGDRGVYNLKSNVVELFGNVIIKQDDNFVSGTHAETDLNTQISRITSDESMGGRIKGTLIKRKNK